MNPLSREDFFELSLKEIEVLTGIVPPEDEVDGADYRERAWESYKQEVTNQEEWVNIEGDNTPEA